VYQIRIAISAQAAAEMKNSRGLGKNDRNTWQGFLERHVQLAIPELRRS
jgi:hypothetical protein